MTFFIDLLVVVMVASAAYIGWRQGAIRQLFGSVGIVAGFVAAAVLYSKLAFLSDKSAMRGLVLSLLAAAVVFLCYDIALHAGSALRTRVQHKTKHVSWRDRAGGAAAGLVGAAVVLWIAMAMFGRITPGWIRQPLESSIMGSAVRQVQAPAIFLEVAHLLSPFDSPDVFAGKDPEFNGATTVASEEFAGLDEAIGKATPSVVKVSAWGCGTATVGSGFLVDNRLIVTNAHVIAGVVRISVQDRSGAVTASPVWFDPKLDMAVLLTEVPLSGEPLKLQTTALAPGQVGAVLGYPGGGDFAAGDAIILQLLDATGYDIYGKEQTERRVYAVRGSVVPGNSGGPLITADGEVAGLVFGNSVSQPKTGYAIAAAQLAPGIAAARQRTPGVNTGSCVG